MIYEDVTTSVGKELADMFEEHAQYFGGTAYVTKAGWDVISERYDKVHPELRMSVMNDMMKELTVRGIPFDAQNFQERPA